MKLIKNILISVYHSKLMSTLIPTTVSLLQKELSDCSTVLDLGCGADSPIQYCKNITYSVGVEIYEPYLKASKKKKIHDEYKKGLIEDMTFKKKQFDAVLLIDVIEHLEEKKVKTVLKKAEGWAAKKVILITPNGFIAQSGYDKNTYQNHLSGWTVSDMEKLGYTCQGLAGLKHLRKGRTEDTKDSDLSTSIKYRPKLFWFGIACVSQVLTYRLPRLAFSLFCVKKTDV